MGRVLRFKAFRGTPLLPLGKVIIYGKSRAIADLDRESTS